MKYVVSSAAALAAALVIGTAPTSAEAAAEVYTHGDGFLCTLNLVGVPGIPNGTYVGPTTIVASAAGKRALQCNAVLVAGSPVPTSAERVVGVLTPTPVGDVFCDITVTPSGHANMNCHD